VLGPEALAAASLHVRTVRSEALTLFFFHTLDAAPSALQRDARADDPATGHAATQPAHGAALRPRRFMPSAAPWRSKAPIAATLCEQ